MVWINLRFTAGAATAESISDALDELGAISVSIDDAAAGTAQEQAIFGEPGMPEDALWDHCAVSALFPMGSDAQSIAHAVAQIARLPDVPRFAAETVAEADWVRLTQAQFDPIHISPRLWIVPTWHAAPDPQAINIRLDPGVAFGTGSHPTTQLCLQWLDDNLHGSEAVLDYGCGSGILAIAAKKFGAGTVLGVDIDPQAVEAARLNAERNNIVAEFRLPDRTAGFAAQVTLANILSSPLKLLAPLLAECTAPSGRIVLSGILVPQADAVMARYERWFGMSVYREQSGWVCLQGSKRLP